MTIIPLLGPRGKIPILIRDDDTNFFTKCNMLKSIYSKAWDNQFKVSLSVIPYQKAINDVCVPPDIRKSQEHYSIENNKELCSFLKERINHNHVEIIQHGVSHSLIDYRGEFSKHIDGTGKSINRTLNDTFTHYYSPLNNDFHKKNIKIDFDSYIEIGRNIIKKSLDVEPILFTPPFDDISTNNLNLISSLGMIPIYGQSNYHRFFRSPQIPNYFKKYLARKLLKKFANVGFIIPFTMSNDDYYNNNNSRGIMLYIPRRLKINPVSNNNVKADPEGDTSQTFVKWIANTISYCMIHRTPLCILNHYHHYFYDWNHDSVTRKNLYVQWNQILDLVNKIPFPWKATFSDLYQRIRKLKKINIARTGQKITIESNNELIEDISFKVDRRIHLEKENIIYDDLDKTIITIDQLKPNSKSVFY
ncbi:MAG: DUF2334 domain-containing protein, partial [Candidatus Nitrosocosmicus sp.]|nr:DUF2334 domain-containing protein [Candidatus Nitrosocosmicus sp.]